VKNYYAFLLLGFGWCFNFSNFFLFAESHANKNSRNLYVENFNDINLNWKIFNCNNYERIFLDSTCFIKIGADSLANPRIVSPEIDCENIKKYVELKLKVIGYLNAIIINNDNNERIAWFNVLACLPYANPIELDYIIPREKLSNSKTLKIIITGFDKNFHDPNSYFAVGDIRLITKNRLNKKQIVKDFKKNLGINYISYDSDTRFTWLTTNFDIEKVKQDIKVTKQLGNTVRILCSADNLSDFDSSGNWIRFNNYINNLDSVFKLFSDENIKIIPTIFCQTSWSGIVNSEKIVSDSIIANGYKNLCINFIKQFEKYDRIIGWDICNESLNTTLTNHLKGKDRMYAYAKAREFMCSVYNEIKTFSLKPVIATFGTMFGSWSLIEPDKYCDIIGYSAYLNYENGLFQYYETNNSLNFSEYDFSCKVPYFISEVGAPIDKLANDISYRNYHVNSEYLRKFFKIFSLKKYNTILAWRDKNVLWDRNKKEPNLDGEIIKKKYLSY